MSERIIVITAGGNQTIEGGEAGEKRKQQGGQLRGTYLKLGICGIRSPNRSKKKGAARFPVESTRGRRIGLSQSITKNKRRGF